MYHQTEQSQLHMQDSNILISIEPQKLTIYSTAVMVVLILLHIVFMNIDPPVDEKRLKLLWQLFDLDKEANIPTLFCTILWGLNAICFYLLGRFEQQRAFRVLSLIFCYLMIDESASIHERITPLLRHTFSTSDFFLFAWIIPYGLCLGLLTIYFLPILMKLGRPTQFYYLLAGAIFILGSIGMEMLAGFQWQPHQQSTSYYILSTLEESMEMIGLILAFHASLARLSRKAVCVRFSLPPRQ